MLRRRTTLAVVAGVSALVLPVAGANVQESRPKFSSVTVVAAGSASTAAQGAPDAVSFRRSNVTVVGLIQFAHTIGGLQVVGGPDWIRTERFSVTGIAGRPTEDTELRRMVQSLLEEEFALKLDAQAHDMSHYVMRASADGSVGPSLERCDPSAPPPAPMRVPQGAVPMTATCLSMADIAGRVSATVAAPVLDRSSISGQWSYRITVQQPRPGEPTGPLVTQAFREQLGLDLQQAKGPIPVLVVQSAARPKAK